MIDIIIPLYFVSLLVMTLFIRFTRKKLESMNLFSVLITMSYIPILNSIGCLVIAAFIIEHYVSKFDVFDRIIKFIYGKDD